MDMLYSFFFFQFLVRDKLNIPPSFNDLNDVSGRMGKYGTNKLLKPGKSF